MHKLQNFPRGQLSGHQVIKLKEYCKISLSLVGDKLYGKVLRVLKKGMK